MSSLEGTFLNLGGKRLLGAVVGRVTGRKRLESDPASFVG